MKRIGAAFVLAAALAGLSMSSAMADKYPSRTVSLVVPYPAGGSVDGVARIVAQKMSEVTGGNFIVENRAGGAGGIVGASYVVKAAPDGYTLLLTASIHVVTPFLHKAIPYNVVTDFTPVSLLASGPLIVSTAPNVEAKNLKEFFELVRKSPDKYTFATSSFGSAGHMAIELLKRDADLKTLVIAYKGAAPMLNDLMGGQVQLVADPMLSSLPLAQSGKIKAFAVTSMKRVAIAPEIPTLAESGVKGFDFGSWYGLWGPKDMPAELTKMLQETLVKVVNDPAVKERLATLGFEAKGSTSAEFADYIKSEMTKYEDIIKAADIKPQ
ncbi:tripartite tricarboxylate transporter substrate binding protein [Pseudolabrys sp. FHR47]|uniref:Bug family tripartite tricarboxylate transporter substrate binding protein n=1 Tax=Pseudolabrys sp. FHR47 TaxID=2562284 RepID=UPI0010BEC0CB|nr:tripartite tricarboxylate transporter substrate binding protein [Pseudolabrys sp. FHR47]